MNHATALILLLTVEYFAHFILQSREVATKKSESLDYLRDHILVIIGALFFPAAIILYMKWGGLHGILGGAFFAVLNGLVHAVTDWNIWKGYKLIVYKRLATSNTEYNQERFARFKNEKEYAEDPWFYNTIGLDRLIHVSTIIFLYFWFI